jgi:hypothetical protein
LLDFVDLITFLTRLLKDDSRDQTAVITIRPYGNATGQNNYGRYLELGIVVLIGFHCAADYYHLAADANDPIGEVPYGCCLEFCLSVQLIF